MKQAEKVKNSGRLALPKRAKGHLVSEIRGLDGGQYHPRKGAVCEFTEIIPNPGNWPRKRDEILEVLCEINRLPALDL